MRNDPRVEVLAELAHPVRLRVVDRLSIAGPATVSEMASALGVSLPLLSNHLRRLRERGLVRVERTGRQALYSLADPGLDALLPLLDRLTGRVTTAAPAPASDFARARTCYDHLAGAFGVRLYAALRESGALRDRPDGTVELGPHAAAGLGALGLDAASLDPGRRRFAVECLDATEHAPHLGGALGAAIAERALRAGWVRRGEGRALRVTPRGERALREVHAPG